MHTITARNAPMAFSEAMFRIPQLFKQNISRNGTVYTVPEPVLLQIEYPEERVLFDPRRDANPFFHLMEALWMFAGHSNVIWPAKFVKRYRDYADPGTDHVWGAYGARWGGQIQTAIDVLRRDPKSRQAVISMWEAEKDLGTVHNDRPCNTHIYLRADMGYLEMTVCNRSNDLFWGMLGANVVHFTMLQELIAHSIGLPMGTYRVFTNNLHAYPHLVKNFDAMWQSLEEYDEYKRLGTVDLLAEHETYDDFAASAEMFVHCPRGNTGCAFIDTVAYPMYIV
jgi:thymidylate synthase